jgi:AraC-like DNA-binding protein
MINLCTFGDQVKKMISTDFKGQVPPIEVIASRMNMTARSFQRRLQEEGQSYRNISSQLRKEFAMQLLNTSHSKMEEIAEVLGYSEASAFRRAFKTWTDTSPTKMRKAL